MDDLASASENPLGASVPVRSADGRPRAVAAVIALPISPPLDAPAESLADEIDAPSYELEQLRTRVAWSKLMYLVTILAVLLAIAQFVPYTVEQVQYSLTRGKERAQYEMAGQVLAESPLEALSQAFQRISQRVGPSVVHIDTSDRSVDEVALQSPFGQFGQFGRRPLTTGQGSGVVIDTDGYVVTNYHVIRGSQAIKVGLSDGRHEPATVVGYDMETDIAVLKIKADKLIAAEWGDSDQMEVGSMVWALGSPFGLKSSVTSGILSGKHRGDRVGTAHQDFMQTDVAVNPGNSGGPLVDTRGRIVGINTAIVGDAYQGVSLAVPSNKAREIYTQIRNEGRVRRGWLGVQLSELTDTTRKSLNLDRNRGVLVALVVDQPGGGSPALKAGVLQGDVILQWNQQDVDTPARLTNLVADTKIGSSAELLVMRDGRELKLAVEVGQRPVAR